jgi:hypothetical protein
MGLLLCRVPDGHQTDQLIAVGGSYFPADVVGISLFVSGYSAGTESVIFASFAMAAKIRLFSSDLNCCGSPHSNAVTRAAIYGGLTVKPPEESRRVR